MSGFKIEIIENDLGFEEALRPIRDLDGKGATAGIHADAPKKQFKRGFDQEFRPETAGTLLRIPFDAEKEQLADELEQVAAKVFNNGSTTAWMELRKIAGKLAVKMQSQAEKTPGRELIKAIKAKDDSGRK